MKTFLFCVAISGLAYWRYTDVPAIQIQKVDWENRKIITTVRGNTVEIEADTIFRTGSSMLAPIAFSKYTLSASPGADINSAASVVRLSIFDGKESVCQPLYIDFDTHLVNGYQFQTR